VIVEELLGQRFIQPSASPWAASVLFALNKDGKLLTFRVLNKQAIPNFFLTPRNDDLIDKTRGSQSGCRSQLFSLTALKNNDDFVHDFPGSRVACPTFT
jgi:hypothetical protein